MVAVLPAFEAGPEDDETDRFAKMTSEERLALFLELCDLTDSIVNGRPDREALRARTQRSPESEALWVRLMGLRRNDG